jgi:hypothetical protein
LTIKGIFQLLIIRQRAEMRKAHCECLIENCHFFSMPRFFLALLINYVNRRLYRNIDQFVVAVDLFNFQLNAEAQSSQRKKSSAELCDLCASALNCDHYAPKGQFLSSEVLKET